MCDLTQIAQTRSGWVIFLLALMVGVGIALGPRSFMPSQPQLLVSDSQLDLGDVWVVGGRQHEISIANPGRSAVHIQRFYLSCKCTSISPPRLDVPPGETRLAKLMFDFSSDAFAANSRPLVPFEVQVRPIVSGTRLAAERWNFRGRAKFLFRDLKGSLLLDANRLIRADGRAVEDTVEITPAVPLACLRAWTSYPHCNVAASPRGDFFRLDFDFADSVFPGAHEFDVFLDAQLIDGTVVEGMRVKAIALVSDEWEVLPAHMEFGLLRSGEVAEAKALIRSRVGKMAASVEIVSPPTDPPISVAKRLPGDGAVVITARVEAPAAPGFYEQVISVVVKITDNDVTATIRVPLRYQVVAANGIERP